MADVWRVKDQRRARELVQSCSGGSAQSAAACGYLERALNEIDRLGPEITAAHKRGQLEREKQIMRILAEGGHTAAIDYLGQRLSSVYGIRDDEQLVVGGK